MEILNFIFQDGWHFFGVLWMLWLVFAYIEEYVHSILKTVMIKYNYKQSEDKDKDKDKETHNS